MKIKLDELSVLELEFWLNYQNSRLKLIDNCLKVEESSSTILKFKEFKLNREKFIKNIQKAIDSIEKTIDFHDNE